MILKLLNEIGIPRLILIVVAGIVLIVLSAGDIIGGKNDNMSLEKEAHMSDKTADDDSLEYVDAMESRLKSVLSHVEGVGNVRVMITVKDTSEEVTLKDRKTSSELGNNVTNSQNEENTVYSEDGQTKIPYVVKEINPQVMGVVVVSTGGDDPQIKKEIIEAVQVLFDIEPHKIKVMKQQ